MISLSSNEYNEEDAHIDADNLMCDILKEFGYEEGYDDRADEEIMNG